jgi:RND family efflux transporter MFP subunit
MIVNLKPATFILLLAFILIACDKQPQPSPSNKQQHVHVVEVEKARIAQVQSSLTAIGTIEASTIVRLYNEVSGRITRLPNREGDTVAAHSVVIGLDDELIQAELDKVVAQQQQAKLDYNRLQKLKPKQLASDEEVARAHTALDIASAEEKIQRTLLSQTVIKAPFDGVITQRFFEPGDVVPLHSHIMTLIDPKSLQVKIQLSENWIQLIQQGDEVEISIDALGDSRYPGRISRIYPTIDPDTRKGTIEVGFLPMPSGARAGQLARVNLVTQPQQLLVTPAAALHHDATGAYVFVVRDNEKGETITVKTYVQKGMQYDNLIAITDGLRVDERIVVKGFIGLRDAKQVKVFEPPVAVPRQDGVAAQ